MAKSNINNFLVLKKDHFYMDIVRGFVLVHSQIFNKTISNKKKYLKMNNILNFFLGVGFLKATFIVFNCPLSII